MTDKACAICDRAMNRIASFYDPQRTVITQHRTLWSCTTEWVSDLSCVTGWASATGTVRHPRYWRLLVTLRAMIGLTPRKAVQKWIT